MLLPLLRSILPASVLSDTDGAVNITPAEPPVVMSPVVASKAIAEYVTRHEGKLAAIQAAKAQADQGLFISQDAAIEWLDSWGTDQELDAPEPDVFRKLS